MFMRALKSHKIYFAKYAKSLPGKPDLVFRKKRVVVFIDSEFWHGHPTKFIMPKSNLAYWKKKIAGNRARDKKVNALLKKNRWKVMRFWEADVKKKTEACVNKLLSELLRESR